MNKLILLILILGLGIAPATAQSPDLHSVAIDESGRVVLFYPTDWDYAPLEDGFVISNAAITMTAQIFSTESIENLPAWAKTEFGLPETTRFRRRTYSDLRGWLAQGTFADNSYTALVILPLNEQTQIVIRSDSDAKTLRQDAPLITAILDKLVILNSEVVEAVNFDVRLLSEWVASAENDGLLIAPAAENIRTPQVFSAILRTENIPLERLLATPSESEQRDFTVNEQPATIQLRFNPTSQLTELVLVQARLDGSNLILIATSANGQNLVRFLPQLQAIFASATVN